MVVLLQLSYKLLDIDSPASLNDILTTARTRVDFRSLALVRSFRGSPFALPFALAEHGVGSAGYDAHAY